MKISIIIPLFNCGKTIERCVESIADGTKSDYEIILIDDGSSDDTHEKCEVLLKRYNNVTLLENTSSGVSSARNMGLHSVTGEIVGFCDSDDTFEKGTIDFVSSFFENNSKADILITGYYRVENDIKVAHGVSESRQMKKTDFQRHIIYDDDFMGAVWNKFIRLSTVKNTEFNEKLTHCEDMNFLMKIIEKTENPSIFVSDRKTYNYFSNPSGVTQCADRLFDSEGNLNYQNSLENIICECNLDFYTRELIKNKMFGIAFNTWRFFKLNEERKKCVKKIMKNTFLSFFVTFFEFPLKNLRITLAALKLVIKNR